MHNNKSEEYLLDTLSVRDSWRMFKIMAEIVEGFDSLQGVRNGISVFGSARTKENEPVYQSVLKLSKSLAEAGYDVITGGGPGLMEAGNRGAQEGKGHSIGLHIHLPLEQDPNDFIDTQVAFRYFFVRKLMFVKYAKAYIVTPGGIGTLDEFFEAYVLIQTKRIEPFPIILFGSEYWNGLLDWMKEQVVKKGCMSASDFDYIKVLDTSEEVLDYLKEVVPLEA